MIIFAAAALLFSGEVTIGPGKTRTLDVQPSPVAARLSATYVAGVHPSNVRLVLLSDGSALDTTEYGDSGELTRVLEPNRAYRLVLDNSPGESTVAKVDLDVRVMAEEELPAATRTWLAAGSAGLFLLLAGYSGTTLWRKIRPSPSQYR